MLSQGQSVNSAVCDRITVLRNGELVGEYETKDLPRVMLVAKMMGKDFDDLADIKGEHKDKKKALSLLAINKENPN